MADGEFGICESCLERAQFQTQRSTTLVMPTIPKTGSVTTDFIVRLPHPIDRFRDVRQDIQQHNE
ncbi:hypothetical protein G9444_0525 [Rhodococcus erythropolis]|uniref:Uncharacterized protein n=1 Tax=Rhodococcus erythropolis TaxID=1833 RepID=A0A6G9CLM9_RHOER|nr:hypothetical protein G9444_0525 [Rhodococcus erythropolis]